MDEERRDFLRFILEMGGITAALSEVPRFFVNPSAMDDLGEEVKFNFAENRIHYPEDLSFHGEPASDFIDETYFDEYLQKAVRSAGWTFPEEYDGSRNCIDFANFITSTASSKGLRSKTIAGTLKVQFAGDEYPTVGLHAWSEFEYETEYFMVDTSFPYTILERDRVQEQVGNLLDSRETDLESLRYRPVTFFDSEKGLRPYKTDL